MVLRLVFCGLFAVCCSGVYSEDISSLGPPGSILVFGDEFNEAVNEIDEAKYFGSTSEVEADYVAEMVRQEVITKLYEQNIHDSIWIN